MALQLLSERGELASRFGRACVAILLLQDLAVVPMLTLVPALSGPDVSIGEAAGTALLKAAAVLGLILLIGWVVARPLFRVVAESRSPELFAAMTLLILLGCAWLTGQAGLSIGLGGFLAGVMLAETEYRHQVAADIHPFRGILLGLFFMTVGMTVNLSVIVDQIGLVVLLTVALLAAKTALTALMCRVSGLAAGPSLNAGLMLSQGGEFAFLLFALAMAVGVLDQGVGTVLFAVVAVTMALSPPLAAAGARISRHLAAHAAVEGQDIAASVGGLKDHVVVAGYGRVGQAVSRMLAEEGVPYVAFDLDPARVARARAEGLPVFYGDASRSSVLRGVGVGNARSAVLTMDNPVAAEHAVAALRQAFPDIQIFSRARDEAHRRQLELAGATGIVSETMGLNRELGSAVLEGLDEAENPKG